MKQIYPTYFFFLLIIFFSTTFDDSHATALPKPISQFLLTEKQTLSIPSASLQWLSGNTLDTYLNPTARFLLVGVLSFIAAVISSAGGLGGGGLFIPILTIVAGFDLENASSYTAFMVTGVSVANVVNFMFFKRRGQRPLIDYEIALSWQPCLLLGVSCGVILNLVLPEWLTTIFFAVFLAFSTFKTFKSGIRHWRLESDRLKRKGCLRMEDEKACGSEEPLLRREEEAAESKSEFPWTKLGMLVLIWFSFCALYLLRGNGSGQSMIPIEACGVGYWIISSMQIPLAIIFTTWILYRKNRPTPDASTQQENRDETTRQSSRMFPIMSLFAGVLSGVFGIGGGMLISPLLLQMGIKPEVTAATCSFMIFFSSTMSATQYLLLGMEHINGALILAAICLVASLIGLTIVQQAIVKHGRPSVIVFSVGTVMAVSTVLMTGYGALNVWSDYRNGKSMGFKKPC